MIGSSLGGWLGSELALRDHAGRLSCLILLDAVGIAVANQPIRDFFALDARDAAEYTWHDAARFYVDLATLPPERATLQASNLATMRAIAGQPYMQDLTLLRRLSEVRISTLVLQL